MENGGADHGDGATDVLAQRRPASRTPGYGLIGTDYRLVPSPGQGHIERATMQHCRRGNGAVQQRAEADGASRSPLPAHGEEPVAPACAFAQRRRSLARCLRTIVEWIGGEGDGRRDVGRALARR